MGSTAKQNSTTFIRCPKDDGHPFNRLSARLYGLNGYQFAIMAYILSNKDEWNLVKYEICRRLGFPERKFLNAWKELEEMGYIQITKKWGSYHYTINEDPGYTTGKGADCMDYTTGSSTSCIGAILTTTNNNYYSITTGTDATCLENKFKELIETYPDQGILSDGTHYALKHNLGKCKNIYVKFLKSGVAIHEEIISSLKTELQDRRLTGKITFMPGLLKWLTEKRWERYRGVVIDTNPGFGCELT